jgi:hypothetical protein
MLVSFFIYVIVIILKSESWGNFTLPDTNSFVEKYSTGWLFVELVLFGSVYLDRVNGENNHRTLATRCSMPFWQVAILFGE